MGKKCEEKVAELAPVKLSKSDQVRAAYDAAPGWSQSAVKAYLTCPEYYCRRYVEKTFDDSDTKSFEFGRAVDEYVANKEAFLSTWTRVLRRSGAAKELTAAVYDDAVRTGEFVLAQPVFRRLTAGLASQVPLYANLEMIPIKGLLDFYGEVGNEVRIIDLKTARSAIWRDFRYSILDYGYLFQLAWYGLLAELNEKEHKKIRYFIAVVDDSCFNCYEFSSDLIRIEQSRAIEFMKQIIKTEQSIVSTPHLCPLKFECPYAKIEDITKIDLLEMQTGEFKKRPFDLILNEENRG